MSPFLNATDASQTDVPWGILKDMSIASGRIEPAVELLKLAVSQHGEVFVGVVLAPSEVSRLVRDVGFVLPNVTMPIVGARLGRNK